MNTTVPMTATLSGGTSQGPNCYANEIACVIVHSCPGVFVMDGIIYLVGLIVIVMFILSFLGLH
jgi:hypothetical protein